MGRARTDSATVSMIGAHPIIAEAHLDIQTGFGATGWGGIGGGIASGCCCYGGGGGGARREPCSASVGFRTGTWLYMVLANGAPRILVRRYFDRTS
eukprot:SAG31_NODE_9619_length_1249_cov_340.125217_1_plen_96_part_00